MVAPSNSRAVVVDPQLSSRISSANIRLDPVNLNHLHNSDKLFSFFMGKTRPSGWI